MTLWQLFLKIRSYIRPYKWLIVLALILTFAGSLTAQVNAWVLRYTVDTITGMVTANLATANQIAAGDMAEGIGVLALIAGILAGKEVLNTLIQFGQRYYGEKLRIFLSRDLAQQVIEKVLTFKLAFYAYDGNQPGRVQTRVDRGVESLSRLVQNFFIDILPMLASAVVALLMMFNANVYVGLVGFFSMPVYYLVSRAQARRLSGARRKIKRLRERKSQGILNILESIPVIKSFLREDIEEEKQMRLQTDLTGAQLSIRRTNFLFDAIKNLIEQTGTVAIILLTTYFVLNGQMTVGAIMFHILLYNNVSAPIRRLHFLYDQMNDALIYAEGFFELLEADDAVEETGNYAPANVRGEFVLEKVTFRYPDSGGQALADIDMTIEPGQITALVGLSGAGKSTLINLLDKFYRPDSGRLLLDGTPLEEYDTRFVRANIGLVLQKNHIFNGTIEDNIRYGKPGAHFEEVVKAAKKAFLHEQIEAMPEGYATSATSLSGGQQQKIAIARMFLKDPAIIFLDEPTASLDAVAAEQIKNSMDAIKVGRTVVIISHSISQIIDADKIYVLQKGRVVESGSHDTLYPQNGAYAKLFDAMARSLNMEKIAAVYKN